MAQPAKAVQIGKPVVEIAFDGKRRGAAGFHHAAREQIFALHHLDNGLGIGRPEFGQAGNETDFARSRPRPGKQGIGHAPVGNTHAAALETETQNFKHAHTRTLLAGQIVPSTLR